MSGKIDVSYEKLLELSSDFDTEIKSINELLIAIKEETTKFEEFWKGDDSDIVMPVLRKTEDEFEKINENNEKYLEYLKKVVKLYKKYDNSVSRVTNESDSSFSIN